MAKLCAYCGSGRDAKYVCWNCHEAIIREIQAQIDDLKERTNKLRYYIDELKGRLK